MSDKKISNAFADKAGQREVEIFLLQGKAQEDFRKMREAYEKTEEKLLADHVKQREQAEEAKRRELLRETARPTLVPPWVRHRSHRTHAEIRELAQKHVRHQEETELSARRTAQREKEDEFLSRQREERLAREAKEAREKPKDRERSGKEHERERERAPEISLKRDFDRSR